MNGQVETTSSQDEEREVIGILIDSSLYLDMSLAERYRLLHFIIASYLKKTAA
ncbi:MAG TPA: hypothetical protein VF903_00850 [Nitrospirota bacterium]